MKRSVVLFAVLWALPSSAESQYPACLEQNTQFYGMYCHSTQDVLLAVRGACRKHVADMFSDLNAGDRAEMIDRYLKVTDETVTKLLLDFRLKKKIDCGQFNDVATPDLIDGLSKP